MKKMLLCALLIASLTLAAQAAKVTTLKIAVADWVRFKTVDSNGLAEFWATPPYKITVDGGSFWFYWSETADHYYDAVDTGVPNKHPQKVWRVK